LTEYIPPKKTINFHQITRRLILKKVIAIVKKVAFWKLMHTELVVVIGETRNM